MIAAVFLIAVTAPCVFAEEDDDAITVYITISDDGEFVTGTDGTVMAHVPVRISYFDLEEYGLSEYYRYEAAPFRDGGEYISDRIIEQPTLLHLYIKVLEKYYAGRPLTAEDMHSEIIDVTGSPTSVFLKSFWGHNFNLMYFVDHAYPLQSAGWGSTCDYILLYDGSEIDVAMFTDMGFNLTGAFTCFDITEKTVSAGEEVTLALLGTETKDGGGEVNAPVPGEPVRVSADLGKTWDTSSYGATDENGEITLKFERGGTYYVSAGPKMVNYPSASGMPDTAPPISVITVRPGKDETPDTPDDPDKPDTPDGPDTPDKPDTPDGPDKPDTPDKPDGPDKPDQPDTPDGPDGPDKPDQPDTPDGPDGPDKPDDSGKSIYRISEIVKKSIAGIIAKITAKAGISSAVKAASTAISAVKESSAAFAKKAVAASVKSAVTAVKKLKALFGKRK